MVFVVNSSAQIRVTNLSDGSYESWDLATLTTMSSTTASADASHITYLGTYYIDAEVQNAVTSMLYYGIDTTNASLPCMTSSDAVAEAQTARTAGITMYVV